MRVARHGRPGAYYCSGRNLLPFTAKIHNKQVQRLDALLGKPRRPAFRSRVAVIRNPSDLGTAFSLYGKPQKYAAFLGLELSFVYRDRLLVVMPNGYGYALNADPDAKASAVLKKLPPPGRDATKEIEAAIVGVEKLAAAQGHPVRRRRWVARRTVTGSRSRPR